MSILHPAVYAMVVLLCLADVAVNDLARANITSSAQTTASLSLPPEWESRVIYYHSFEREDGRADIIAGGIEEIGTLDARGEGFRGRCGMPGAIGGIELRGGALSPHRPLAVSFWWALQQDANKETGFGLFHLTNGTGFISHFARSGPWCALEEPAGVAQVYYLPGIQNVNGIYERHLMDKLELKAGVWHHTAVVITAASLVAVYTNGQKVFQIRTTGRDFSEADRLLHMKLGSDQGISVALDEVIVLNRPLQDDEVATYVRAMRQMRAAGYPVSH
jgi:hypothetical protein